MKTIASMITAGAILLSGGFTTPINGQKPHVIAELKEATWGPAPPMLPPGAHIAVLSGDPTKSGPYTIRLKFPANYAIAAHSHPTDENVVVVSGALTFGMGEKLIKGAASNKTLTAGGYALMPEWNTRPANHYLPRRRTGPTVREDDLQRADSPLQIDADEGRGHGREDLAT